MTKKIIDFSEMETTVGINHMETVMVDQEVTEEDLAVMVDLMAMEAVARDPN